MAKLQAEAKAATAQSDSATAAAMEAKGLAKRLEALAIQKQQHAAVHAVPGQPGHVQNSDAQRAQQAQRAVPPAPQGPVKPSGLMKPSLLAHSPSRLSRMTMQDDNALEESSKGSGLQFRSREDSQGAMDARSTVSRIVSPQTTGFSNSGSKRQSHDNSEGVHQLHPSNPSHSGATLTELQQRTSDHERSRGVELHQQDRLRSQGSIKRSASEQSEQAPASIVARRITLQQEQSAASSDAYDGLALRPQLSVLTPEQQRGRESGSYSAQHATSRQASDLSAAVHAESQDLNKQVWQQAEGDDIAAAVAQYTGSKHGDFPTDGLDHQGFKMVPGQHAQHACEELPHDTARPRLALQHGDNFKKSESFHHREHEDSDRHAAELSYVEQQARMDAEFEDAMLADQSSHQDLAEHGSTAKQYATPQEQMEAELEAAMAADAAAGSEGFTQGGDADRPLQEGQWGSPESTSTSGEA